MNSSTRAKAIVLSVALVLIISGCGGDPTKPCISNCTTGPNPEFVFATSVGQIQNIKVNSTSGALGSPAVTPGPSSASAIVADPSSRFLYVSDYSADAVDIFSIDANSGALSSAGAPVPIGPGANGGGGGLAMDPKGKFLFATDANASTVTGFSVNGPTGALTPIAGSTVPTGNTPFNAAVDPSGKFLYVSNLNDFDGSISAYTINPASGALTAIAGSPFATLSGADPGPEGLAVSPDGRFLYVALSGTATTFFNFVAGFTIDATTGALSPISGLPFVSGTGPSNVVVDPTGKFLYTADIGDGTISAFSIDAASGALTPLQGYPLQVGVFLFGIAIDQSGRFLYASDLFSNDIHSFGITPTGALTPVGQSIQAGHSPSFLTVAKVP